MSMNSESDEARRLARELAELIGERRTIAETVVLSERLDRVCSTKAGDRAQRFLAIGRDCAAHLDEPYRSGELSALLYDKHGLPT